jgi:arsenite-transporting ATPase
MKTQRLGDQLIVQIHNQRRNYLLPQFLSYYTLQNTRLYDGWLHATFAPVDSR